ncbi:MAG: insecticidal toxin protein [Isosphaeraceae bacterium]|jgi:hypothetical protein
MTDPRSTKFHGYYDARVRAHQVYKPKVGWRALKHSNQIKTEEKHLFYYFYLHAHPFVAELVARLIQRSVPGLLGADTEYHRKRDGTLEPLKDAHGKVHTLADGTPIPRPVLYEELFSHTSYNPSSLVGQPYPVKDLDFTSSGAYSVYNWELFYHIPLTIAVHLSQNQRFEEAQRWFHYIFDPTDDSDGPTPERFWKVKPFQYTDVKSIEQTLVNLSTGTDPVLHQDTINSIGAWTNDPFRPFLVARYRQTAFMFKTVMAYLDNLITWGDSLFSQYTGETINEAAQLYILAAHTLGRKPQAVPSKGSERPQTYAQLRAHLDQFGNALVDLETAVPFDATPHPHEPPKSRKSHSLAGIGKALYFCVPRNDKLLQYWDTVADRLFKIRNSLNIQGIFQRVPLFEPPIDPAMLVRAAAAGLDVSAIVSGLNQPLPLVRFQYLVQKAAEICQEVKSLGGNLLAAMEKHDNEALSILRAKHETAILKLTETVKYSAWQEAIKNREGLNQSIKNAAARYVYYERQLNKKQSEIAIPSLDPLDAEGLAKMKFSASEPSIAPRDIDVDIAKDLGDSGGYIMSSHEADEMNSLWLAHDIQEGVQISRALGVGLRPIPNTKVKVQFWGLGADLSLPGGLVLADLMESAADIASAIADHYSYEAGKAGKVASYARRQQDWEYQSNLAAGELNQLYKQLRAAEIREAMAKAEWKNHQTQIKQAEEIEHFLTDDPKGKMTNQAFYAWMKREVKGLYGQSFQFAFDIARKAERALQQELGDPSLSFIEYGYLAGKEGLLAGEKLYQDIKRMEMAYVEQNQREYELTKHVSLVQVNPMALLQLRATGSCTVTLAEELFDFDCPGHYFRRIKSVAVSIPCVVGPYTTVNCRLTLLKSSIRINTLPGDNGYPRTDADDPRFSDFFGSVQSIVTSSAQSDSGLFETNLHDERKLPFEWSGTVSQWQLDIPADVRQFDFDTIADVILHLRYTAREGGDELRKSAVTNLKDCIDTGQTAGSVRLFSLRREFPSDWAKFTGVKLGGTTTLAPLAFTLRPEHYPFWSQGRLEAVLGLQMFAETANDVQVFALALNQA